MGDAYVVVPFEIMDDLGRRKLLHLPFAGMATEVRIVSTSLEDVDDAGFVKRTRQAVAGFSTRPMTAQPWMTFARFLRFLPGSAGAKGAPGGGHRRLDELGGAPRRLHCLSVPTSAALAVVALLDQAGLVERSRTIMEKFGTDLASAEALDQALHQVFMEEQIFQIVHFLGKEAAQTILAFRFSNGPFARS